VPWLWKPNCADGKGTKLYTPANMPYGLDFLVQPSSTNTGYMSNYAGGSTGGGLCARPSASNHLALALPAVSHTLAAAHKQPAASLCTLA
jgi:hypothetical protein